VLKVKAGSYGTSMKASSLRISTYRNWLTSDLSEGTGTVEGWFSGQGSNFLQRYLLTHSDYHWKITRFHGHIDHVN
ncbi:MAG: hypothetical protein WBP88_10110, partial [Nitrososphaeraceae archaeon]